jgi:hypothetical protein
MREAVPGRRAAEGGNRQLPTCGCAQDMTAPRSTKLTPKAPERVLPLVEALEDSGDEGAHDQVRMAADVLAMAAPLHGGQRLARRAPSHAVI